MNKFFKRIMVELEDGNIVDISDLPREKYEYFLNMIARINDAYRIMILNGDIKNNDNESQSL
jgi:uncharacterized alpha/beta hydrolase family protein